MGLTIREFREADTSALSRLWSLAFRSGKPRESDEPIVEGNSVYVAEVDGEVCGGFTIEHMDATRGDAVLRCGGVAGVAVLPESRFSGIGREMMRFGLERMRSDGYALSSLYPFKEGYYRRLGYEVAGQRFRISVDADRLPAVSSELAIRAGGAGDWEAFAEVYGVFARRYSGMWTRSEMYWRDFLKERSPAGVAYLLGDPAEGYVAVPQLGDFWGETSAREVVWTTPGGYRAALCVLKNLGVNRKRMTWFEPSDSPYLAQFFDYGAAVSLDRQIMFRVVDVAAALGGLRAEAEGEFSVEVLDDGLAENRGPWLVRFGGDGVFVERTDSADFRIGIGAFSQAVLGQPSLDRLAAHGLVSGGNVEAACRLLTPMPACCYNFF